MPRIPTPFVGGTGAPRAEERAGQSWPAPYAPAGSRTEAEGRLESDAAAEVVDVEASTADAPMAEAELVEDLAEVAEEVEEFAEEAEGVEEEAVVETVEVLEAEAVPDEETIPFAIGSPEIEAPVEETPGVGAEAFSPEETMPLEAPEPEFAASEGRLETPEFEASEAQRETSEAELDAAEREPATAHEGIEAPEPATWGIREPEPEFASAEREEAPSAEGEDMAGAGAEGYDLDYPDYIFGSDSGEMMTAASAESAEPSTQPDDLAELARELLDTPTAGPRLRALLQALDEEEVRKLVSRAYAAGYLSRREEKE